MRSVNAGVCAVPNIEHTFFCHCENMLAIRIYIAALTLIFLVLVIANRSLGILEAVVITCAIIYLILDVRTDLQMLKAEFRALQELEQRISELLR